jgi:uncharacterized phiE125 gp8 family phage protein
MKYRLSVQPAIEPVTLQEVKNHVRVLDMDFDAELTAMITAARQFVENYLNQSLITQTWLKFLNEWPKDGIIKLHKTPLQSVDAIYYVSTDAETELLPEAAYTTDIISQPAIVKVTEKPELLDILNPIMIQFVCGYGSKGSDVPQSIKHAILLFIAHLFEHRGDDGIKTPPPAFYQLLNQKRVKTF